MYSVYVGHSTPNMAVRRTRRPRFCSGRSLRRLGSPLNARRWAPDERHREGTERHLRGSVRVRGLATIADIPTEEFNALIASLQKEGWCRIYKYMGFDAWID